MYDLRPVGYVIGLLVLVLGLTMLVPLGVDLYYDNGQSQVFLESAILTANSEMPGSFESEDFQEGVAHFMERRPPNFSGK